MSGHTAHAQTSCVMIIGIMIIGIMIIVMIIDQTIDNMGQMASWEGKGIMKSDVGNFSIKWDDPMKYGMAGHGGAT